MDLHCSLHVLPFLHALEMLSLCPLYWLLSFWTPFSTKVWLGLTICWRRTSERNLSVGSLHALVPCFTRSHQALGWSSCLALSNQQACVRPTVSAKTQNPKQVSLNPKAQLPQITSPANLLLDTRTRTNQGGWLSFSL